MRVWVWLLAAAGVAVAASGTVEGTVTNSSSEPLSIAIGTDGGTVEGVTTDGAAVVLVPAGARREWADLVRQANAGAGGRFELRDVAPGEYQLLAWQDAEPGAPLDADFRAPFVNRATAVSVKAGERVVVTVTAFGK